MTQSLKQFTSTERKRLNKFVKEMRTIQTLEPRVKKHDCGVGRNGPVLKPSERPNPLINHDRVCVEMELRMVKQPKKMISE